MDHFSTSVAGTAWTPRLRCFGSSRSTSAGSSEAGTTIKQVSVASSMSAQESPRLIPRDISARGGVEASDGAGSIGRARLPRGAVLA